jgi:hypothetical protein
MSERMMSFQRSADAFAESILTVAIAGMYWGTRIAIKLFRGLSAKFS